MTTYNTGNPIGSKDPRDLYDNAENLDEAVNTRTAESWDDRFGVARKTWWGMEQDFQQFLINSGYENIGDYGPGLEITARNQIFWRDGELYRAGAVLELPYTTTGDWGSEEALFVEVGDAALRQELASKNGLALIGGLPFVTPQMFGAKDISIDPLADSSDAIIAAIAFGKENKIRVTGNGTFRVSKKIVINTAFDGSDINLEVYDSPPIALEVSTGSSDNPTDIFSLTTEAGIILPSIRNMGKPEIGWEGQGIGVRYVNVQNMRITERLVEGFNIGVQLTSYDQGCGYNTVQAGYLRNNKINREVRVGNSTGFTNRWDIIGGRSFHSSSEGIATPGVMHVNVEPNATGNIINNINFFGGCFEGSSQEYHVRLGGSYINFIGSRWENNSGDIKIRLASSGIPGQGSSNAISLGRGADAAHMNVSAEPSVINPRILIQSSSGASMFSSPNTAIYKNTQSAADPVITVIDAGDPFSANPVTDYTTTIGSQTIRGKRASDQFDRVRITLNHGRLLIGNGLSEPVAGLSPIGGAGLEITGGMYLPGTSVALQPSTGRAAFWFSSSDGTLKFRLPDGTIKTIATTD